MKTKSIIIISILSLAIIFSVTRSCTVRKADREQAEQQLEQALINQKDKLQSEFYKLKQHEIDSIKKNEYKKLQDAKNEVAKSKQLVAIANKETQKRQAELDSLLNVDAPCTESLTACIETNNSLYTLISAKDSLINDLGNEAENYSRLLFLSEKQYLNCSGMIVSKDSTINRLNAALLSQQKTYNTKQRVNKIDKFIRNTVIVAESVGIIYLLLRK